MRCRSGLRVLTLAYGRICGLNACNQRNEFVVLDHFPLEQTPGDPVKCCALVGERTCHAFMCLVQQPAQFVVDELGRVRSGMRPFDSRQDLWRVAPLSVQFARPRRSLMP